MRSVSTRMFAADDEGRGGGGRVGDRPYNLFINLISHM